MLAEGRDLLALIFMEKRIGALREQYFKEGARKTSEQAVEMSHRALVRIPFVGQPGFGGS